MGRVSGLVELFLVATLLAAASAHTCSRDASVAAYETRMVGYAKNSFKGYMPASAVVGTSNITAPRPLKFYTQMQSAVFSTDAQLNSVVNSTLVVAQRVIAQYLTIKDPQLQLLLPVVCTSTGIADVNGAIAGCSAFFPDFWNYGTSEAESKCGPYADIDTNHIAPVSNCSASASLDNGACFVDKGGVGVNTDYYLYVTAEPSGSCSASKVVAGSACHFFMAPQNNYTRPAMGWLNFCPDQSKSMNADALLEATVHQLLHLLGFSEQIMRNMYMDASGNPRADVTALAAATGTRRAMQAPAVMQAVNNQFGCGAPNVTGMWFEDQGQDADTPAHWEFSWAQGDMMTAQSAADGQVSRISPLTLAALGESNWYMINPDQAQGLSWGKNAGCMFLTDCGAYATASAAKQSGLAPYFCATAGGAGCSASGVTSGACDANTTYGNTCGFIAAPASAAKAGQAASTCTSSLPASDPTVALGAVGGTSSVCLTATGLSATAAAATTPLCVQANCGEGTLTVNLAGFTFPCPPSSTVDLSTVTSGKRVGALQCPMGQGVCEQVQCGGGCANGGACVNKTCVCAVGYTGTNCALRMSSNDTMAAPPPPYAPPPPPLGIGANHVNITMRLMVTKVEFKPYEDLYRQAVANLTDQMMRNVVITNLTDISGMVFYGVETAAKTLVIATCTLLTKNEMALIMADTQDSVHVNNFYLALQTMGLKYEGYVDAVPTDPTMALVKNSAPPPPPPKNGAVTPTSTSISYLASAAIALFLGLVAVL